MKPKEISVLEPFSWKRRSILFFGILGSTFLFVEMLGVFGLGEEILTKSGKYGYALLIVLALSGTILEELIQVRKKKNNYVFIQLNIFLVQDGSEYKVLVPRNMLTARFVQLFFKTLEKKALIFGNSFEEFETDLFVVREGELVKVNSKKTLFEEGLKDDDVCRFAGRLNSLPGFFVANANSHLMFQRDAPPPKLIVNLNTDEPIETLKRAISYAKKRKVSIVSIKVTLKNSPKLSDEKLGLIIVNISRAINQETRFSSYKIRLIEDLEEVWIQTMRRLDTELKDSILEKGLNRVLSFLGLNYLDTIKKLKRRL